MKNKILILTLGIFLIGFISAQGISYCCEKTTDGAWCQNSEQGQCDLNFRNVPTSCEATSYCKLGTCIDSQEGTCMENTPQKVCNEEGGVWKVGKPEDNPQCQLGCCLIGDQAAYVTQTRCKKLSSLYGLETNYRTDIKNEVQCIMSATSDVIGACVFEKEYETTCELITQRECQEKGATATYEQNESDSEVNFHEGYLCSNEDLGTNCGPSKKTKCVGDEVYFLDTCGNLANIYDSSKIKNKNYWSKIYSKEESCGAGSSNADSSVCGNCDYYLGSTCKQYQRGEDKVKPNYGDFICRDLSCEYDGEKYEHGETWCVGTEGAEENLPGSRFFRLVCYNGDVTVEPCADFRQEICVESEVNSFSTAACRVNKWQDCIQQNDSLDCKNSDKRDCQWIEELEGCAPKYAPGFDFWNEGTDAESLCGVLTGTCVVTFEKKLKGGKDCIENCECLDSDFELKVNQACGLIGDCGYKTNYLGVMGYHTEEAAYAGIENPGEVENEKDKNAETKPKEEED
jgi:hypothetical protein